MRWPAPGPIPASSRRGGPRTSEVPAEAREGRPQGARLGARTRIRDADSGGRARLRWPGLSWRPTASSPEPGPRGLRAARGRRRSQALGSRRAGGGNREEAAGEAGGGGEASGWPGRWGGGGERLRGPRERAWRGPGEPEPTGREHRGGGGRVRLQAWRGSKEKPGKSELVGVGGACSSGGGLELPGMLAGVTRGQGSEMWG